jgi:VIT1/CCC1 family predicted Fe2+/Mn2+ transporter
MKQKRLILQQKYHHSLSILKKLFTGGIDGIVTTFAVVAGFSGAALSTDTTTQLTFMVVLLFGLANLFADAASMGLGNFLSVRSEKDLYNVTRAREERRIRENAEKEIGQTVDIMMEKGFSESDAKTLGVGLSKKSRVLGGFHYEPQARDV